MHLARWLQFVFEPLAGRLPRRWRPVVALRTDYVHRQLGPGTLYRLLDHRDIASRRGLKRALFLAFLACIPLVVLVW